VQTTSIIDGVSKEFQDAEIPDWRLRSRLVEVAETLDLTPEASISKASRTPAAREAAYRFLGNHRVTMDGILAPHVRGTVQRCNAETGVVYVVSDTTECTFSGESRAKKLGRISGKDRGFLGHFALAVSGAGVPLGVLGIEVIVREDKTQERGKAHLRKLDPDRESLRWAAMVEETSELLGAKLPIHVMDSEADIYELLSDLEGKKRRYIIRGGQDRLVEGGVHLDEVLKQGTVVLNRQVKLSRRAGKQLPSSSRRNPPREARDADLSVSATRVALRRPKTSTADYPKTIPLNVVRVWETNPPEGEKPVEWILFTSEPIDTANEVAAVVDGYRRRWIIEEYFKALKTGCSYEDRELESIRTLTNLLGIVSVIAWRLLKLRVLDREAPDQPATNVIQSELLEALAARLRKIGDKRPFPTDPTVADLMKGIARLGGYVESKTRRPGWQVLWTGYQDLLTWGDGFIFGRSMTYKDQT
jgi:Transposase DNA-binding/Transposase DDE domain